MAQGIADYFASVGVNVDKNSIKKVDKFFNDIEKRLKKLGSGGKPLSVNLAFKFTKKQIQDKLNSYTPVNVKGKVGIKRLDIQSQLTKMKPVNVKVNPIVAKTAMARGLRASTASARVAGSLLFNKNTIQASLNAYKTPVRVKGEIHATKKDLQTRVAAWTPIKVKAELSMSRTALQRQMASMSPTIRGRNAASTARGGYTNTSMTASEAEARGYRKVGGRGVYPQSRSELFATMTAAGSFSNFTRFGWRALPAAIPLLAGAHMATSMLQPAEDAKVRPLTHQAVFLANGRDEMQATDSWHWYKGHADRLGFNYGNGAQAFSQFMANSMGAGLGVDAAQDTYKGFSEYATAMGLSTYRRDLVNTAY